MIHLQSLYEQPGTRRAAEYRINTPTGKVGASGAGGQGTAPIGERFRVRFPVGSLEIFK
jgi:hypothetical protein